MQLLAKEQEMIYIGVANETFAPLCQNRSKESHLADKKYLTEHRFAKRKISMDNSKCPFCLLYRVVGNLLHPENAYTKARQHKNDRSTQ